MDLNSDSPERFGRIMGCLLGGAVGDALGAPAEFMKLADMRCRFGPEGIKDLVPAFGRLGAITDDTQMALFTVEGLIRAHVRGSERGVCHPPSVVYHAYLRWLHTQGEAPAENRCSDGTSPWPDGWLVEVPELQSRRAPGNTCMSALRSGTMGTIEKPINSSKGCGGVMRVAPAGFFPAWEEESRFKLGAELAAITHGHPTGYLAAGFLAEVVGLLADGKTLSQAVSSSRAVLTRWEDHQECLAAVDHAVETAASGVATAKTVERLGQGWVAEEALGISLYCALVAESFEHGVCLAVNHGGDSDSTGAITGNILGTMLGPANIPHRWLDRLECRDVIVQLSLDFARQLGGDPPPTEEVWGRYPGW